MLLCVCLWVCNLCVKECVFLRSLCQCVCSSNTGFSPYYPHLPPSFLSSLLMVTHQPPVNPKPNLIYPSCHYCTFHISLHATYLPHTDSPFSSTCPSIHFHIHCFIAFGFRHQPSSTLPSLLISAFSLFLFSSSRTLSTRFSSLPPFLSLSLSLFHTVLCASLTLAGLLLGGWEFVCTQVPAEHPLHPGSQPGSASLLLILLLLLLSLPFFPEHSITTVIICPLYMIPQSTSWWMHSSLHRPASWCNTDLPSLSEAHCSWVVLWCPLKLCLNQEGRKGSERLDACMPAWPNLSVCLYFYLLCCAWSSKPVSPFWPSVLSALVLLSVHSLSGWFI